MMSASKSTATPTTQAAAPASSAEGDWIEVKSKRTKPKKDAASPAANGKANAKQPGAGKQENASSGGNAQRQRKEGGGKANQSKEAPASPKGNASGDDQSGSKPQKRKNFVQPADDALKEKWIKEVQELKAKLVLKDDFDWKLVLPEVEAAAPTGDKSNPASWANRLFKGQQPAASAAQAAETSKAAVNPLSLIGGFDLSYLKGDNKRPVAVAALVVCTFPALEVVYESIREVKVDEPYLSGFLSFREVPHFLALLNQLKETKPELMPQLLIVDGNGLLHQKGFGLACHLGVLANLPTIGVAKKLFTIDGINEQSVRNLTAEQPLDVGEAIELRGRSGTVHGAMMQTKAAGRAIFLSIGHRISLKTAVDVVRECCPKTKLPVPVEIADVKSRDEVANVEQRIALAIQRRKEKKLQYEAQREQRLAENNQRRKERENQRKERGSPKENGQRGSPKGGFDRKGGKGQAKGQGQAQGGKGAQGGRAAIPRAQQGQQPAAVTAAAKTQQAPAQQATAPAATQPAATPATTATTTTGAAPAAAQALAPAQPQSPTQARVKVVNKTPQGNKAQQQAKGQGQQGKQVHQPKKQN